MSDQKEVPENANDGCVGTQSEQAGKVASCQGCPNQKVCASGKAKQEDPAIQEVADRLEAVKHKILVLSGKGGVGKSSFASQLTWFLGSQKREVGILDIDICGPSIPRMMGVEDAEVRKSNFGWSPVYTEKDIGVMSIAFMLSNKDDAVIWRGPRKNGLIKQFLTDVYWQSLDYLIVDAPPGTSDEHISIAQYLKRANVDGAVLVTTPQEVALLDVRKEVNFCKKVNIPILGVVENMSGFICPCCEHKSDIFAGVSGGAEKMCQDMNIPFLGKIPLDPQLLQACEKGKSYFDTFPTAPAVKPFKAVLEKLLTSTPSLKSTYESSAMEED